MSFPFVESLPELGTPESESLDFKRQLSAKDGTIDRFEVAKDVAAFANTIGGTLLIGAITNGNRLAKYDPFARQDAERAWKFAEECVRDRCNPGPAIAPQFFDHDGGVVLGIHITPSIGPIAVRVKEAETAIAGGHKFEAWLFFERITSHTREFQPELLPMLMDAKVRRTAILLRSIPKQALVTVQAVHTAEPHRYLVWDVNEYANRVVFRSQPVGVYTERAFPLDGITHVFCDQQNHWVVVTSIGGR